MCENQNVKYAGHSFKWMDKFTGSIKGQRLRNSIAISIACCICHQYNYKKQGTFKLSHRTLAHFGLNPRSIKPYLNSFQQAGLIKFSIEIGKTPTITLLLIPPKRQNKEK